MSTRSEKVDSEEQLHRVRKICVSLPETTERISHGEPTFFVRNKVYAMFANNHHDDGHVAIWIPVPPGYQGMLINQSPERYFKPPYVGVRGWVGVELDRVSDDELAHHLSEAWSLIAPKKLQSR